MENVLVILQTIIVSILILVIMLQKPTGDTVASLGIANIGAATGGKQPPIVKVTWLLVFLFFLNSMIIARSSYQVNIKDKALIDDIQSNTEEKLPHIDEDLDFEEENKEKLKDNKEKIKKENLRKDEIKIDKKIKKTN